MTKKSPPPLTNDQEAAILLLRYHNPRPKRTAATYMKLQDIAASLGLAYTQVRRVCDRSKVEKKKAEKARGEERRLNPEMIAYLTAQSTLQAWAGMTLKERCVLFHRRYIHKRIGPSTLCRLYRQHGIKRKVITRYKAAADSKIQEMLEWQEDSWK